jgi:hypothetical protein
MAFTYAALKSELQTDPTVIGYAALGTNDVAKAAALNLPRAAITIRRSDVSAKELWEAIDVSDYTALGASPNATQLSTERRYLAWLTGLPAFGSVRILNDDGSNGPVAVNLLAMFPNGSPTRARIVALASRQGSRAEQLFGEGVAITAQDVGIALQQT